MKIINTIKFEMKKKIGKIMVIFNIKTDRDKHTLRHIVNNNYR